MESLFQAVVRMGALLRLVKYGPILIVALLSLTASRIFAQNGQSEYAVKGAFLYNFAKFVQWPASAFADSSSPIIIGIFGHDSSVSEIESVIGAKTIDGRRIVVRTVSNLQEAERAQILFIPAGSMSRIGEMTPLRGTSTLVIGEAENFAHKYGDIGFVPDGTRLGFEINSSAARSRGLTISSKLLRLAKWVG